MWGNTLPMVCLTCAHFSSLFFLWISSLPIIIPRALISLYYNILSLWRERLTVPKPAVCTQVLHEISDEADIAEDAPEPPNDLPVLRPRLFLSSHTQRGPLDPFTINKLQVNFYQAHFDIHSRLPCAAKPIHFDINQLLCEVLEATVLDGLLCSPLYPNCQPADNDRAPNAAKKSNTADAQPSASRKRKASSTPTRKTRGRRLNKNNGGDDGDDNNNNLDPRHSHHTNVPAGPEQERFFACHLFKLNPRKYHRCGSKQLKSVDTLKQHMKRAHCQEAVVPCHQCWELFAADTEEGQHALREHSNSGHCSQEQGPDTLYDEDLALLDTRRGASDEEKWYQIWDQLCPEYPRPDSPYIERNGIDEFGGLIGREYQSRILGQLPSLCSRFPQNAELVTRIVNILVNETFSHPIHFDSRFRRIFRPAITVPPEPGTHQPEASPESPSDAFRDDYNPFVDPSGLFFWPSN
ncbi:hypothetical protein V8F20_003296 [Naviculisporaceae sp. PSN 640]